VSRSRAGLWVGVIVTLFTLPLAAQQGPVINPRIPPPPPPPEQPAPPPAEKPAPPAASAPQPVAPKVILPPLPRVVPATIELPAGTRFHVVLDTPMSSRISRTGQQVVFRTEHPIPLPAANSLELPPDTTFIGSVVEMKKPGSFGKQGEIRVEVRQLQLSTGQFASVNARLDSADPDYAGKGGSEHSRAADIINLALWTAQGTVLGASIHGGSGAAAGAGAGVLVGLIIMASHRGQDVYLEPGTPFSIILEQPVTLSGPAVLAAEENYRRSQPAAAGGATVAAGTGPGASGGNSTSAAGSTQPANTSDDSDLPRLKRRPPAGQSPVAPE
jgi:hypothetical protein